jgi:hypothetical protein
MKWLNELKLLLILEKNIKEKKNRQEFIPAHLKQLIKETYVKKESEITKV